MKSHPSNRFYFPLPVVDVSTMKPERCTNLIQFFNGMTSPVVINIGRRSFLVSDISTTLKFKNGNMRNPLKKVIMKDVLRITNEFVKEKMFWSVRFNGENVGPLEDRRGMKYIHNLISNPYKAYTYHELHGAISETGDESSIEVAQYTDGSGTRIGRITTTIGCSVETGDEEARKNIVQSIQKLYALNNEYKDEINRLSDNSNPDVNKIEKLEKLIEEKEGEIERIEKNAINYSIGRKTLDRNEKNLRNQIQTAIERSINMIALYNIELAKHLKNNIKRKYGIVEYRPPDNIRWITIR